MSDEELKAEIAKIHDTYCEYGADVSDNEERIYDLTRRYTQEAVAKERRKGIEAMGF